MNGSLPPSMRSNFHRRLNRHNSEVADIGRWKNSTSQTTSAAVAGLSSISNAQGTTVNLDRPMSLSCLTPASTVLSPNVASSFGRQRSPTGNNIATTASLLSVVVVALIATSSTATMQDCNNRRQSVAVEDSVHIVIRLPVSFSPGEETFLMINNKRQIIR